MRFSQRLGKTPVRDKFQIEEIDQSLANGLWNNILDDFFAKISRSTKSTAQARKLFACKEIWKDFFGFRLDELPKDRYGIIMIGGVILIIKEWYFKAEWFKKYDLIEFIANLDENSFYCHFTEKCNQTLQTEMAGYRIVNSMVIQITDEREIAEIEQAIESFNKSGPVEVHLNAALNYLSNREDPDYRNSIKESISAVESFCGILTSDKDATLGKTLKHIEVKYKIHGSLKTAFSALYGYTSDSGGIRHALVEDDIEVTMEEAKFMLIICSAFINYLKAKS